MTEAEWLADGDPTAMLDFFKREADGRKLRLYACACCRCEWDKLTDERSRAAVAFAEKYADGLLSDLSLWEQCSLATTAWGERVRSGGTEDVTHIFLLARTATEEALRLRRRAYPPYGLPALPSVMRDILGNPFRHFIPDSSWLTSTTVGLAETIYEERAFDRLPILADALQDAGCEDADVLGHCRGDGVHVRGCWVVDGVLGKG
ncbi:hypothetical protein [Limnoglobus roseus]|uniref:SMI1/KNR4 family protein n=1 Tax=Limnoglobus roseus TaxID=2598579 RepID=A0A5C1AE86_9BACT|nr:hypothetical protein [Limnoglobus roseus]QEL17551.1 SMI1/KNR4 family protein [Limnoglobus roseus]